MGEIDNFVNYLNMPDIEGKDLLEISIRNYFDIYLDMDISELRGLRGDSYTREYIVVAKSRLENFNSDYIFHVRRNGIEDFLARGYRLVLKEIKGVEGVYRTSKDFYLSPNRYYENINDILLTTPLYNLLGGCTEDKELEFIVNLLKEKFEGKYGFKYKERAEGDLKSFLIEFSDGTLLGSGFSNTIQVDFGVSTGLRGMQITYRDTSNSKIIEEVNLLDILLNDLYNKTLKIDGTHSVSDLMAYLKKEAWYMSYSSNTLLNGKRVDSEGNSLILPVVHRFIIGNIDSFRQVEALIDYDYGKRVFLLKMNFLFREIKVECDTICSLIGVLERVKSTI